MEKKHRIKKMVMVPPQAAATSESLQALAVIDLTGEEEPRPLTEDEIAFIENMIEAWPGIIARSFAQRVTGGLATRKTIANADALGIGPPNSFTMGRKRVYWATEFWPWVAVNYPIEELKRATMEISYS